MTLCGGVDRHLHHHLHSSLFTQYHILLSLLSRTIATTRDVHDAAEQLKTVDAAVHEEVVKRQSELDQLRAEVSS